MLAGMTGTLAPPTARAARPTSRADAVTALLSVWFTAGLLLDAWAHNNLAGLESFFTPWHAVFYSGFAATAGWLAWTVREPLRAVLRAAPAGPRAVRDHWRDVPRPYRTALLAAAGFAVCGVGDMLWHLVFGIEQDLTILFSPTHLGLAVAMTVIVSTPLRTARDDGSLGPAPGLRRLLPAVAGAGLATALVLLFLQYGNALVRRGEGFVVAFGYTDRLFTAWVLTSVVLTTVVLVVPVLTLARAWRLPAGAVTVVVLPGAALSLAVSGGTDRDTVAAALVGAVLTDVAVRVLRPGPDRPGAVRALGGLLPLLVWTTVTVVAVAGRPDGVAGLEPEIVLGMPVVQGLVGLLLAVLVTGAAAAGSGPVRVEAPRGDQVVDR